VTADSSGNVTLTGNFTQVIDFGKGRLTSAGAGDIYVAKLAGADGTTVWSRFFGGTGDDLGKGVATDSSGNIFLTGTFGSPSVDFGGGALTNRGADALFVV